MIDDATEAKLVAFLKETTDERWHVCARNTAITALQIIEEGRGEAAMCPDCGHALERSVP